ncbi:MAG: ribonuclease P protein component [Endomicrobiia bacterium]|jgi:ribonuclease P protein component|nr:ribonuclease P protein component [Endomicrobiaceae bacterium]MDD3053043.1 ribonuclease P protein component [Endomicrobiaceae bacterium]MDD3922179.1 ribonuclease P protein component [Endomicrobiaceae bacterium]
MLNSSSGFSFCYQEKLHLGHDYKKVFKNGKKIITNFVNVFVFDRKDNNEIRRLGLVTSKKVGNAAERNRAKRRLREIFRTNKHKLTPGLDIIFILKPEIKLIGYGKIKQTVLDCLKSAKFYNDI